MLNPQLLRVTPFLVDAIPPQNYTGSQITPVIVVKDGATTLTAGTDYTVNYGVNTNVGGDAGNVTVTGAGKYAGSSGNVKFTIAANTFTIDAIPTQTYTGNQITPAIVVKDGAATLIQGTDYTVSYGENMNTGTGSVVVTGAGKYAGSAGSASFTIATNAITIDTFPTHKYTGTQIDLGVRAGLNLNTMKISGNGLSFSTDMKPGFQAGLVLELALHLVPIAIQPGIIFAQQKYGYYDFTMTLNYIQIPVNVMYKIGLGTAALLLQTGPYLGYGIGREFDYYKAFDFGLGVGAGVQLGPIQAGIGYNLGLANMSDDGKIKNNGLVITLTYLFGK